MDDRLKLSKTGYEKHNYSIVTLPSPAIHLLKLYRSLHIDFLRGCLFHSLSVFRSACCISTPQSLFAFALFSHNDFKSIWTVNKTCGPLCGCSQPNSQTSCLSAKKLYVPCRGDRVYCWHLKLKVSAPWRDVWLWVWHPETLYSIQLFKGAFDKSGDWMSLACNWCTEGCFVSARVMTSKRRLSEGSESVWWFRVIVWQLIEREWKTAWQIFTTLWNYCCPGETCGLV